MIAAFYRPQIDHMIFQENYCKSSLQALFVQKTIYQKEKIDILQTILRGKHNFGTKEISEY